MKFILCAVAVTATLLLTHGIQAQGRLARVVSTIIHNDETKTLSNRDFVKRTMEQQTFDVGGVLKMKRICNLPEHAKTSPDRSHAL